MTLRLPPRAALAAALFLWPANPAPAGEAPINEFRFDGSTLVCNSGGKDKSYLPCLRIGPVYIGQRLREVSKMFGKANRVVKEGDVFMRVYVIRAGAAAGQRIPYWVIGFRNLKVISIQITSPRGEKLFAFSSIQIGDAASKVTATLGPPTAKHMVKDVSATYWDYDPFTVGIEIMDGRVYTMFVSKPPGG